VGFGQESGLEKPQMTEKASKNKAVVLLSGGLDSTTCLALAADEGLELYSLAFDYGQRHQFELQMAARQARAFGVREHQVVRLDLGRIAKSALTADIPVPKNEIPDGIPSTYVPARNAVFLSLGLAWAEGLGASDLFIGVNQVDFSGYPDCRGAFVEAFERMANLATRAGTEGRPFRVRAPLLDLDKTSIIKLGLEFGVDYENTHTCYDPRSDGLSCGHCPACLLRLRAFAELDMDDPAGYVPA
jgi:7-cyano-7-deazaguanine synthase